MREIHKNRAFLSLQYLTSGKLTITYTFLIFNFFFKLIVKGGRNLNIECFR